MERILINDFDDGTTLITINRPERKNAICAQTAVELQQAFEAFDHPAQRVAVLTGSGNEAFSIGADVTNLPELWRAVPTVGIRTEKPVIAAVGGWCVGGALVVTMMCDLRVAAENARSSYPEAKLGFTGGMISGLAARVPHKVAMEMILLCRTLDARRAHQVGLVNEVVATGTRVKAALAMAREMAAMVPLVLATLKRFIVDEVLPRGPSERMALAAAALEKVRNSGDGREGAAAFREKRNPVFKGV